MKKGKYWFCWTAVIAVFISCFYSTGLYSSILVEESSRKRADVIKIDFMSAFGKLEKSPVEFLHDSHTEALAKKNKDCKTCHLTENDCLYPKFKRTTDTGRIEVMNIYHEGCISCHGEMKVAQEKAGPVECDGCHREKRQYSSSLQPMGFDKFLHFRHSKAHEKKCEQCHHEYDEKTKKLFYAKGKEGTCRYCHEQYTKKNRVSMRMASHIACINCHIKSQAQNKINLPVNCSKCHDPSEQKKIKKPADLPRMEKNQPDILMIKTGVQTLDMPGKNRMNLVPFNHKSHEGYSNTCRICHHQSMKKCSECHTLNGSDDGKGVPLQQAMHRKDATQSCIGCHEMKQRDKNCAGCHRFTTKEQTMDDDSCLLCHTEFPKGAEINEKTAQLLLAKRPQKSKTYKKEDIPEMIVIKKLSEKYKPVEFPHRKIVSTITENIADNKLAAYFHAEKGTICKGCHHNSPATNKPTLCSSCHGKPFDEKDMHKPGIIGAYHIQCMECHTYMKIDKVGCTDCHKEKNS